MPLIPEALISVSEARRKLRDDEADQGELEDLINAYSISVWTHTERQAWKGNLDAVPTARTFEYDGGGHLSFAPYELRAMYSALTIDGISVAAGDGLLQPRGGTRHGTFLWMRLLRYDPYYTTHGTFDVIVTGLWGMPEVPWNFKEAVKIAVADGYRNPEGFASRSVGGMIGEEASFTREGAAAVSRELPEDAKGLLEEDVRWASLLAP